MVNILKLNLNIKSIFTGALAEILTKYAPVLLVSMVSSAIAVLTTMGSFGDAFIANSIDRIVPSWVEISYKQDKIKEVLKDLQSECGQDCYVSQVYLKKINIGVMAYFNIVMGYSSKLQKVVDIKSLMDSNSIYYQYHFFPNEISLGLGLLGAGTNCAWASKNFLREKRINHIVALLDSLRVDIKNLTFCYDEENKSIVLLTWQDLSECGHCLDNVHNASVIVTNILQNKVTQ